MVEDVSKHSTAQMHLTKEGKERYDRNYDIIFKVKSKALDDIKPNNIVPIIEKKQ